MSAPRPRVVAIGGGHGLSRTLQALRRLDLAPTAIVTVADDGGSSGRLRRHHGIIALGDLRMALLSLARREDLSRLLGHRFTEGEVTGHSLGNLALLGLIEQAGGDVEAAVARAGQLLECQGAVWPCTTEEVTLVAEVDGTEVEGQVAIATTEGRHRSVWLEPTDPPACQPAVAEIKAADVVLLGPGSLFTSVIPNLLVPGIREAIASATARVVYLANLTVQAGETGGMDAADHVDALRAHLPGGLPLEVLTHVGPAPDGSGPALQQLQPRDGMTVHGHDLAERHGDQAVAAHDVDRLQAAIADLLGLAPSR